MPEIDASIIAGIKPPQTNPLDTVAKVAAVRQGLLNNRLLSQDIGGREAMGRAVKANTNPETGDTDWDKAAAALSQDAQGAFKLPEFAASILDRKAKEISNEVSRQQLTQEQLKTSQATFKAAGDWMGAALAAGSKDPSLLTPQALAQSAKANLIDTGIIDPTNEKARDQLVSMVAEFGPDPKKNAALLKQFFLQSHATSEGIGMVLGSPQNVDTGPNIVTRQTSPLTGETATVATLPKALSPSESAALVEVVDPVSGARYKVPRGSLSDQRGAPPAAAPGGGKNGRYPGAAPAASTPAAPAGPAGAVAQSSLAPGQAEARTASATQSATNWQKDLAEAGGYAQRIQGLDKAYENLVKADTGPGTKRIQDFRAVFGSFSALPKAGQEKVNSYAEAQKYLQDYANRRGAELGIGTDAGRTLVNAANPGVQTPKGAALQVVTVIKGLERMQAAQVAAAQAEGVQPDQYAAWKAKWNRSVDPAAFVPQKLTKEGWEAKKKELGDRWPAYKKGLDAALAAGVLTAADLRK